MKDRETNLVVARTVDNVKKSSLHEFVKDNTGEGTEINTDETGPENHKAVSTQWGGVCCW